MACSLFLQRPKGYRNPLPMKVLFYFTWGIGLHLGRVVPLERLGAVPAFDLENDGFESITIIRYA